MSIRLASAVAYLSPFANLDPVCKAAVSSPAIVSDERFGDFSRDYDAPMRGLEYFNRAWDFSTC